MKRSNFPRRKNQKRIDAIVRWIKYYKIKREHFSFIVTSFPQPPTETKKQIKQLFKGKPYTAKHISSTYAKIKDNHILPNEIDNALLK